MNYTFSRAAIRTATTTWLMALLLIGCPGRPPSSTSPSSGPVPDAPAASAPTVKTTHPGFAPPKLRYPTAARIVAVGDIHGDLKSGIAALKLAGAIDEKLRWKGGKMTLVQTGDILDRGDDEPQLLELFERLEDEARAAGGRLIWLNGNHEILNVGGDFRYVSPDGIRDYTSQEGRKGAFKPGGPVATILAGQPVVAIVGDTVFTHGGLLPRHVHHGELSLQAINRTNSVWMLGRSRSERPPTVLESIDSPVWTRRYSWGAVDRSKCAEVTKTLAKVGAKRLVVGHTVQDRGISSSCNGAIWRIDTGMSSYYGGPIQVLEIVADRVRVIGSTVR